MLDEKCGYGYSYNGGQYYQFPKRPVGAYIIIDCVRLGDDSVALVHSRPTSNEPFIPKVYNSEQKDAQEFPAVRYNLATSRQSGINGYKRYVDSGKKQTLYCIGRVDGPVNNPTVTAEYPIQVSVSTYVPKLKLENSDYTFNTSQGNYKDKVAKNLQIMNLDNIISSISVKSVINNKEWIIEQSSFDTGKMGYTEDNQFITDTELNTVYTTQGRQVDTLEIHDNKVTLAQGWDTGHFTSITWYFAWENVRNSKTEPTPITGINWNELTGDDKTQWYRLIETYGGSFV